MVKICDSAKFYSNIGLNYIVAKINITKYNPIHQSSFVDITNSYATLNLLPSISHDILCNGSEGRGSKPPLPTRKNCFFDEKWKKEKGEIRGSCLHFLHY